MKLVSWIGLPQEILTDMGKNFMSSIFRGICKTLQIKQLWTSIYQPQTDRLVEQFNRMLKGMIWVCIQGDPSNWDEMLPTLLFAIWEASQISTAYSPFELGYGHQPWGGILDLICENWTEPKLGKLR